jgi:hypothetical protein
MQLFPRDGEVPSEYAPPAPIHQRNYLVNGEMKAWNGQVETVRSPVCVRGPDGQMKQIELGSYPVGGEEEAEEALAAAVAAYDDGCRADCLHAELHEPDGNSAARGRQTNHVGDRQIPSGFREGVR